MFIPIAFRRIMRHPIRSFLTILQITLGAAGVTFALGLIQGRDSVLLEPDIFRLFVSKFESNSFSPLNSLFRQSDLHSLQKIIPGSRIVELYNQVADPILQYKNKKFKLIGVARVNPPYEQIARLDLLQGTFFTENDLFSNDLPIIISSEVSDTLFKEKVALGQVINLATSDRENFTPSFSAYRIVGVFKDPDATPIPGTKSNVAFIPFDRRNLELGLDIETEIHILAQPGLGNATRIQALEAGYTFYQDKFQSRFQGQNVQFSTSNNSTSKTSETAISFDPQLILFSGLAVIMLTVCSIGIFSIQLVDISERTKEIGMRRALGATKFGIVLESLSSAVILAGLGAVFGVLIAVLLLPLVKNVTGPFLFSKALEFSPIVALETAALVLILGVILGIYPALLASRLKPVEALREM
jgi:putative ABC transport system permease protein